MNACILLNGHVTHVILTQIPHSTESMPSPFICVFLSFCTRRFQTSGTIVLYGNSRRCLWVCVSVCLCVMCLWCVSLYGPWNSMSFLCLFHVVAIELEFWNFAHAFLASIPICMHGFIMIRILLLPFAYVLKILKLFLYSFRFKELGARNSTRR